MAFVPGYEDDIFISYSHTDNQPIMGSKLGWVDVFEDLLRQRLRARFREISGTEIEIFRDRQLQRFGKFSDQLADKISSSATFICILSPGYAGSTWCLRELSEFCGRGGRNRIIKVVKTAFDEPSSNPDLQALFAEIKEILDFRFYRKDEATGFFRDLQPEINPAHVPDFIDLVDELVQNLLILLKQLRITPSRGAPLPTEKRDGPVSEPVNENQITVYLAETTRDLADKRDEIRTELSQFNCNVLPDKPISQDPDELVDRVRRYLERSKLSVHMLGANYGVVPELEDRSIPRIQYDLANELSREGKLIQLVWMPEGLTTNDERQQRFIDDVKNDSPEYLRTKLEDLKTEILKKLAPSPTDVWRNEGTEGSINISLFCHQQDMESVAPLYSYLKLQELFRVKLPLKDTESLQDHKQVLQTSDAVLLYYGTADEDWFGNIWRLIQRQVSAGRSKPVLAKAIYAGQPSTMEKDMLIADDPLIIKNYGSFTPNSLTPFIEKIKAAKGGAR